MATEQDKTPRKAWRGFEELLDTPEFHAGAAREFPTDDFDRWDKSLDRRHFLAVAGASLALAGVSGCSPRPAPAKKIMPYIRQPEHLTAALSKVQEWVGAKL